MTELTVKEAEAGAETTIRITDGDITVSGSEAVTDIVDPFANMQIMVGQEPPKENDTPAEERKPATDSEIAAKLTGVLRQNGYGVKRD